MSKNIHKNNDVEFQKNVWPADYELDAIMQFPYRTTLILTTIDTTSGYIWMPLVSKRLCQDGRAGIYDYSVSLLATPLDLRVYLDFGGNARKEREDYYHFLEDSNEYQQLQTTLSNSPCLEVFDIDWYSAMFNRNPFDFWLKNERTKAIKAARHKLGMDAHDNSPITWNRCLHGYIFAKHDLGDDGFIDFSMIAEQLRIVINIYQAFQAYVTRIHGEHHV